MTTEILRSMLYKGSEVMKEVGWVLFDEIHYMRDKELVCWLHRQPVHVVYTDYRPTPLQHLIFPVGGEGLYEVVNGQFLEDKFTEAISGSEALGDKVEGGIQRGRKSGMKTDSNVVKIILTIKERSMLPCIIFSFSRKECEAYALSLKNMDFNDDEEKTLVREIYSSAVSLLKDDDKKIPQIGQIVVGSRDFGWAVFVSFYKKIDIDDITQMVYILEVLMEYKSDSINDVVSLTQIQPATEGAPTSFDLVSLTLDCVDEISFLRLKLPPKLDSDLSESVVQKMVKSLKSRFHNNIPLLDPIKDMHISEASLIHAVEKVAELEERSKELPLRKMKNFNDIKTQWPSKGRCACELSATDELLFTEMFYGGVFTDLTSAQIAALLSCFVFQENAKTPKLAEELFDCLRKLHEYARRIAKLSVECKLDIIEDKYVESFKPGMIDVVYEWVNGVSFEEIIKNSDIFEGSIIRCLRRLEEVLREMVNVAKAMQNPELEEKF
ncbi:unnamed protein product [Angiostrongylus costaricensis]|uniref:DSHCT domain-containing protein n=1 Tax=Angiostrongylus costaricensis TaxID=334426 RepID=A0A158PJZ7_ANGCS|nr:unnamed protein product [Angiostrongylus costaricensis]